ncbi:glycosyl transferase family 1 [Burkholderia sp. MSMB617WGS]|uniref:glycosyltransferase family 4 protein n=1 Tax=Burkholderia sp. MSMB617WGS TaxID=1637831 RepID=UPI00075F79AD|nr:glycosyltransferase family 1 protein [Burkholderia sp. MSMB617WGS]AOK46133.1 glycosyl transferase family 1 [Burkholderia sp. MSMB617WGS]
MKNKVRVLVELRPALDGYSGIPQETRLLFRTLLGLKKMAVTGLLQQGGRDITAKMVHAAESDRPATQIRAMSKIVVSFTDDGRRGVAGEISRAISAAIRGISLRVSVVAGFSEKLGFFAPAEFEDFVWRRFFAKTLPVDDRPYVLTAQYRILPLAMATLHRLKISISGLLSVKRFKKIETRDFDIFISQTPFPGVLSCNTKLIVRYHDAIPIFLPHTIKDRAFHHGAHYDALARNVHSGAYFACVSAATRNDLLKIFPEIEDRAVVIHNTVSPIYREVDSPKELVKDIVSSRLFRPLAKKYKALSSSHVDIFTRNRLNANQQDFEYLLMVSTVEPRKNHTSLVAAWELLRSRHNEALKLVLVGDLGWDYAEFVDAIVPWVEKGELFLLSNVAASDLRDLYKHATVTICPSYAEGFDYSGVESMMSGGVVAASDIPVHREVYEDACIYFNPYSVESIVGGIREAISLRNAADTFAEYRQCAKRISARYTAEAISPRWDEFIQSVGSAP